MDSTPGAVSFNIEVNVQDQQGHDLAIDGPSKTITIPYPSSSAVSAGGSGTERPNSAAAAMHETICYTVAPSAYSIDGSALGQPTLPTATMPNTVRVAYPTISPGPSLTSRTSSGTSSATASAWTSQFTAPSMITADPVTITRTIPSATATMDPFGGGFRLRARNEATATCTDTGTGTLDNAAEPPTAIFTKALESHQTSGAGHLGSACLAVLLAFHVFRWVVS